jgi:hypothetical protein
MVLNTMNQLNNISLQSVGEDCVISEGLKRILVFQKGRGTSSASCKHGLSYKILS